MDNEPQWRAALGPNAEYYLEHFRKILTKGRRWLPGWNLAACVHSTGWFGYRRMYGWALLNLFAPWLLLLVLLAAGAMFPGTNLDTVAIAVVISYLLGVFVFVPTFADSLYFRHLSVRLPRAQPPSAWTMLGAAALALVSCVFVVAMLLPSYADYTPRAKVSEAVLAGSMLRTEITEFHQAKGRLPGAGEVKASEVASKWVQVVVWDPAQRAVIITMRDPFPGKRIALRVTEASGGGLDWKCSSIDIDPKHVPRGCRN